MNTKYIVKVDGDERLIFWANLAEASAPVDWLDPLGERAPTPFQTVDGRHDEVAMATAINNWLHLEGGAAWDYEEDFNIVIVDP